LGNRPTGRRAIWTRVQIGRFENEKIVESWVDWDIIGLFTGFDAIFDVKCPNC
jgi:predicted ester cyclase